MTDDRSSQRLGRGLASLIGTGAPGAARPMPGFAPAPRADRADDTAALPGERTVAIGRVFPNPNNPRRSFDEAELHDLAASIRNHGIVQPLLVRPRPGEADAFEIVAGERRWRAAREAGLAEVPIVLRDIGDRQSLEIAIIENVQRADLNAVEEALAYQMLIDEHGYTQADLGDVLGKSRSHVANTLRLLKLPESVRAMVASSELSPGHARTAVTAADPEAFAREIARRGLSVREAEELARDAGADAGPQQERRPRARKVAPLPEAPENDGDTAALERLLSAALGTRVEIRLNGESGSVKIDYASLEELDEICSLLQAKRAAGTRGEPRVHRL